MYLFFDTETTGLPRSWKAPVSDPGCWPHIVQIAWAVFDADGAQLALYDHLIKPEGFVIPPSATAIHGISTEMALAEGRPIEDVLEEFSSAVVTSTRLVAHNLEFDEKMVQAEFVRLGMPDILRSVPENRKICTMKSSASFCKIPGRYGDKWPKLSELHNKLFDHDFEVQHRAAADVLCCAKCFFELRRRAVICEALAEGNPGSEEGKALLF